jgi:cbb3-type cytochrome oxidase subunit 3
VRRQNWRLFTLILLLISLPAILWLYWPHARQAAYGVYRDQARGRWLDRLNGYEMLSSPHFHLHYSPLDADIAPSILETAEEIYPRVVKEIGFAPPTPVVMVIYPDRETFRREFGWHEDISALGVYWTGTIRLLSPHAWMPDRTLAEKKKAFRRLGPIAHELAHLILDYVAHGNYPRWFTEGVAQRVEYQVTGYLWMDRKTLGWQPVYSLRQLDREFDYLPNQALAYRQSFLMVDYLAKLHGPELLKVLYLELGRSPSFRKGMERVYGLTPDELHAQWWNWYQETRDQNEPVT